MALCIENELSSTMKLMMTVRNNDVDALATLLYDGTYVDSRNNAGLTPLHIASSFGYKDCANLLIHHGADVNAQSLVGLTSLMIAAREGHRNIVYLLVEKGADPRLRVHNVPQALGHAGKNAVELSTDPLIIEYLGNIE